MKEGEADFELKCSAAPGGAQQSADCRRLSGKCLAKGLTRGPELDQKKIVHVRIFGAAIDGDVDLTESGISGREISIERSVLGRIALDNAKADQLSLRTRR